eukprot:1155134-Pelagomonas_calceolata.AAC.4
MLRLKQASLARAWQAPPSGAVPHHGFPQIPVSQPQPPTITSTTLRNCPHTCGQSAQHAQGSGGNAVHAGQAVASVDGAADGDGGDDARLVAQGKAKDHVCGGASAARVSHILCGCAGKEVSES